MTEKIPPDPFLSAPPPQKESDQYEKRLPSGIIRRRGNKTGKGEESVYINDTDRYVSWMRVNNPQDFERAKERFLGTGGLFEAQVLGRPLTDEINERALKEGWAVLNGIKTERGLKEVLFVRGARFGPYREYRSDEDALKKCFELAKNTQGEGIDPEKPVRELPRGLRAALLKILNIPEGEGGRVKYYSSVGTILDHTPDINADAFFEIDGIILKLDITMRESKDKGMSSADLVIAKEDLIAINSLVALGSEYSEENRLARKSFEEQVNKIAENLADIFRKKLEEKRKLH